jgi:hypothetical protein
MALRVKKARMKSRPVAFSAVVLRSISRTSATSANSSQTSGRNSELGANIANGVANLLGANKPAKLNLRTKFAPEKFTIPKEQFGVSFSAGPEFESGGHIVGLVEVKIQADKPSIFRVKVTPDNIFATAKYVIDADGTLSQTFEKEIAGKDIPVPGAAINTKGLINIGPSVYAGLWAGVPKLEARMHTSRLALLLGFPKIR